MASVLIRNVDEDLHKRLKASAASHRRSLEEEARELLRAAVARQETRSRENIADIAQRLFGREHGVDLDIPPARKSSQEHATGLLERGARRVGTSVILLDTNIISDLVRQAPDPAVLSYVRALAPDTVFTAAVCEAEVRYGLARMPVGQKRERLVERINALFGTGFQDQIIPFDRACAALYGEIRASREAIGKP